VESLPLVTEEVTIMRWQGIHRFTGLVDVSGAAKVGFGNDPALAGGRTFYVDMSTGSDGRRGQNPKDPLETMTAAMDLCVSARGDAIVVMAASPSSPAANETFPIAMDVSGVLLTGLYSRGLLSDSGFGTDVLDGNTITVAANYTNVENLYLGVKTGGTAGNVIEGGISAFGFTLRNCVIENQYTALYGFYTGATFDFPYLLIEDNFFGGMGSANYMTTAILLFNVTHHGVIRRNVFAGCSSYSINLGASCAGAKVLDNRFKLSADTDGFAIYAASGSSDNYIDGNHAANGYDDPANDPYHDANGSGTDNDWGLNYKGITALDPKVA